MRGVFSVDKPDGSRWELAIAMLMRGEGIVSVGQLLLYRDTAGPMADGVLHVEICSAWRAENLTLPVAEAEIRAGLNEFDSLLADPRLTELAKQHSAKVEYVDDYETGRTSLAEVDPGGSVSWGPFRPGP